MFKQLRAFDECCTDQRDVVIRKHYHQRKLREVAAGSHDLCLMGWVADLGDPGGGPDDVREEDGREDPVGIERRSRRLAGEELLDHVERVNDGKPITFFEVTTAVAFMAFAQVPADAVLLETGLGGRYDATNVLAKPAVTALTSISMDHMQYLGTTLAAIAEDFETVEREGLDWDLYVQWLAHSGEDWGNVEQFRDCYHGAYDEPEDYAAELAMKYGWRLSVQTHLLAGVE